MLRNCRKMIWLCFGLPALLLHFALVVVYIIVQIPVAIVNSIVKLCWCGIVAVYAGLSCLWAIFAALQRVVFHFMFVSIVIVARIAHLPMPVGRRLCIICHRALQPAVMYAAYHLVHMRHECPTLLGAFAVLLFDTTFLGCKYTRSHGVGAVARAACSNTVQVIWRAIVVGLLVSSTSEPVQQLVAFMVLASVRYDWLHAKTDLACCA